MSFLAELKRRNVVRTAVTYVVVSWLLIQIGNTLFTTLDLGAAARKLLFAILLLGFIPTVLFSWAFEITPEGIKHEREVEHNEAYTNLAGKRLDIITIILVVMAMLMFAFDRYTRDALINTNETQAKLEISYENSSNNGPLVNKDPIVTDSQSIAVLAFDNMSQDKSNSYFSDGISEEILNALVKVKGLRVVARSSSFAYKGQNSDLRELGEKLNAGHLLEGSVRRDGDRVRISATLINAQDGFQMWSNVYNRELDDIFKVQEEIAKSIVDALRLNIMPDSSVGKVSTNNIEAYDIYLKGKAKLREANVPEDFIMAVELFDSALKLDINFTEAHAGRCEAFTLAYIKSQDTNLINNAIEACDSAQNLDADAPQVLISRAELYTTQGDFDSALTLLARAIALRPNDTRAYKSQGHALALINKTDEAIVSLQTAIQLQPDDAELHSQLGIIYFTSGNFKLATEKFLAGIQLNPNKSSNYSNLGGAYFYLGEFGKAAETYRQSISIAPNAAAYSNAGTNYYYQGEFEAAASMFQQALDLIPTNYLFHGNLADTCRWLNSCALGAQTHYKTAITLADEAIKINASDLEALSQRALYLSRTNQAETAQLQIENIIKMDPKNPDTYYTAALIAIELKDIASAQKYTQDAVKFGYPEKALQADPDLKGTISFN